MAVRTVSDPETRHFSKVVRQCRSHTGIYYRKVQEVEPVNNTVNNP